MKTAHSKLHDPKKNKPEPTWKIVMVSEGGTKHDYRLDFATQAEAEQAAAEDGWRLVDENRFEWRLEVEVDLTAMKQAAKNRNTEEVEAESISYAVCQYFGIETGENSFGYIAGWSQDKELKELRASLEIINKTSCELISDIERNYKEICKERGIDLTAALEPEQAPQQAAEEKTPAEEVSQPSAEYRRPCWCWTIPPIFMSSPATPGWGHTLYDAATMKQLDGGQLDGPDLGRSAAVSHICEDLGMGGKSIKYAPLSMIETLQEQASQQTAEAAAAQLPDAQEQALDEYPMPDPALTQDDLEKCGYMDSDLLPLSKERAYELMERNLTVYIIQRARIRRWLLTPLIWMPMTASSPFPVRNGRKARS